MFILKQNIYSLRKLAFSIQKKIRKGGGGRGSISTLPTQNRKSAKRIGKETRGKEEVSVHILRKKHIVRGQAGIISPKNPPGTFEGVAF